MTNGEKIQKMFPSINFGTLSDDVICNRDYSCNLEPQFFFNKWWWNAEYKELTTKNDLGVDCVSRQEVDRLACRYLKEPTDNHVAFYEDFLDLPSVTPQEPFINKPCVSSEVCEHDKQKVLDKIRAEMFEEMLSHSGTGEEVIQSYADGLKKGLDILDKYKAESEEE